MITIISGTNRTNSNTRKVVDTVAEICRKGQVENQIYDLCDLPEDIVFSEVFGARTQAFQEVINQYVANVDKFIFVLPEYNGGFPGVVKVFLDAVEPHHWWGKKAAIVGLATGRGGNIRGLDHITNILNYLRVSVLYFKPTLSGLPGPNQEDWELTAEYHKLLSLQLEAFEKF